MKNDIDLPEDRKTYAFDPDVAHERASRGYDLPDGSTARWTFDRLALAQACGLRLLLLGREAFDDDGRLTEYPGYLNDMLLCLHIATMSDDAVISSRFESLKVVAESSRFFDRRRVQFGDPEFDRYEEAFLLMLKDALFSESRPEIDGEPDPSAIPEEAEDDEPGKPTPSADDQL